MGDYIAIRYRVKIKPEFVQQLTDAGNQPDDSAIFSWQRARLKFADPVAQTKWLAFLNNEMSFRWPGSDGLHYNPQQWKPIEANFNILSGVLKGTQCLKNRDDCVTAFTSILELVASEWLIEIDIRDTLFDLSDPGGDYLDTYTHKGNDLSADRRKAAREEANASMFGFGSN